MKTVRNTNMQIADKLISESYLTDNISLLEPSAGTGTIIDRIYETYNLQNVNIDCVELNKEHSEVLKQKGYNVFNIDFLKFSPNKLYDRIIAAPPFKGNIDVVHIQRMYELLRPKGIMVSLTSPYWVTNNEAIQIEFREWLKGKEYYIKMLEDNSFIEKGKTVPTAIIKFFKK